MFANYILFVTFCSMGTLVLRKKTQRYSARKVMEFGPLMIDILVYVSCKFEMYILKNALIITENVLIAFLYVLSICLSFFLLKNCFMRHMTFRAFEWNMVRTKIRKIFNKYLQIHLESYTKYKF